MDPYSMPDPEQNQISIYFVGIRHDCRAHFRSAYHGQALGTGDLGDIVSDYADDAICRESKIHRGEDGDRAVSTRLMQTCRRTERLPH
ncbi:hypothetical protein Cci01nite_81500 [Catellatospora citrea]|uniref:Uncharacterized protein n=1 Tax=Catellatospora citrea TaxID=53366 RepID=A0A8J3KH27_9ACTN|nr:hypothetical protein Cci01nite_81500 [Catellatospora citrea]